MKSLRILETPEDVARAAAEHFVAVADKTIAATQRFSVALSGGSTPQQTYRLLASDIYRNRIDWSSAHLFFGDERCVAANDPASNYRLARETFLSQNLIPSENVHPISGEGEPALNAKAYEDDLRSYFGNLDWPLFDLVLLGLGDDGHTASLFPNSPALQEKSQWVAANWVEKLGSFRITLTASAINHANEIVFIVTGKEKAQALKTILQGPSNPQLYPAQLIQPGNGSLLWLVDRDAATFLEPDDH
jgi:6-phosphogluconolactonase